MWPQLTSQAEISRNESRSGLSRCGFFWKRFCLLRFFYLRAQVKGSVVADNERLPNRKAVFEEVGVANLMAAGLPVIF
jgi:hypothetical protein